MATASPLTPLLPLELPPLPGMPRMMVVDAWLTTEVAVPERAMP